MTTSFSGGRSLSTRRQPPTIGKQLVNGQKKKDKGTNSDLQNTTQKTTDRATRTHPNKNRGWTQVLRKGKQFLTPVVLL